MKKLGATGQFPRGKLNNNDEGELAIGIAIKDRTIIIDFGKQVAWLGLDANTAEMLANNLIEKANQIRSK